MAGQFQTGLDQYFAAKSEEPRTILADVHALPAETHLMCHGHTAGHEPMGPMVAVEATYPQEMWTSRTGSLPQMGQNFGPNVCVVLLNDVMPDLIWLKNLKNFRVITYPNTTRTKNLYNLVYMARDRKASHGKWSQRCCDMRGHQWHQILRGL